MPGDQSTVPAGNGPGARLSVAVFGASPARGSVRDGIVIHSRRQTAPSQREAPQRSVYQTRLVPTTSCVTPSARSRTAALE